MAQHRSHGHSHGGNLRFGISLGVPLFALGYYRAPYYAYPAHVFPAPVYAYPSVITGSSAPPVYIEQGVAQPAPAPRDWYYCAAANAYYPQVGECPAGWQRVPAQAPAR